jgi:hypothetical protein
MNQRLEIATHIYARLILRDLRHAIDKPQESAHRALLFADALLLCDQQSSPIDSCSTQQTGPQIRSNLAPAPQLAERLMERRNKRPTMH